MDDNTAATVLKIQLDDINELLRNEIIHHQAAEPSDLQLALEMYQRDLHGRESLLHDRRVASSFATAVDLDEEAIDLARREEAVCVTDHSLARRLSGLNPLPSQPQLSATRPEDQSPSQESASLNRLGTLAPDFVFPVPCGTPFSKNPHASRNNTLSKSSQPPSPRGDTLKTDYNVFEAASERVDTKRKRSASPESNLHASATGSLSTSGVRYEQTEFDSPTIKRKKLSHPKSGVTDCAACGDESMESNLVRTACDHMYCHDCVAAFLESALRMDSTFPPACCDLPLTLSIIERSVSLDQIKRYKERQDAIAAACTLRCAHDGCKTIISHTDIQGAKGCCPVCSEHTCLNCKLEWHEGQSCKDEVEREKLINLAASEGWQVCYRCRTCVGISSGCNHITLVSAPFQQNVTHS